MIKEALIILCLAIAPAMAVPDNSDYCDGWEKGYPAGWCYPNSYSCLPPLTPACPMPKFMRDSYQDGYNDGFLRGRKDRDGQ